MVMFTPSVFKVTIDTVGTISATWVTVSRLLSFFLSLPLASRLDLGLLQAPPQRETVACGSVLSSTVLALGACGCGEGHSAILGFNLKVLVGL